MNHRSKLVGILAFSLASLAMPAVAQIVDGSGTAQGSVPVLSGAESNLEPHVTAWPTVVAQNTQGMNSQLGATGPTGPQLEMEPNAAAGPTLVAQPLTDTFPAKGMPLGGFRLFPTLSLSSAYDDNVFFAQTATKGDYFFNVTPYARLQSQWDRHELDVYAGANLYQYATLSTQDRTDWNAGGDGRLDIYQGVDLSGNGSYTVSHIANSSPDQPTNAKTPSAFSTTTTNAVLAYHPYHFGFSVGGTFDRYVYDPTLLVDGSSVSNADRNEDQYLVFAKGSYEFSPGYAMFVQANDNNVHYDLPVGRNSNGYTVNAGLDMLVTDLINGEVFAGYIDQRYLAPFANVSGPNYGARVNWSPTPLWTFHLTASRGLNGTIVTNASTEDDQSVQLAADFLARPDLIASGYVGYLDANFVGSPLVDTYYTIGLKLNYALNEWMSAYLSDGYQRRVASVAGTNFDDNIVTLGLKFQE